MELKPGFSWLLVCRCSNLSFYSVGEKKSRQHSKIIRVATPPDKPFLLNIPVGGELAWLVPCVSSGPRFWVMPSGGRSLLHRGVQRRVWEGLLQALQTQSCCGGSCYCCGVCSQPNRDQQVDFSLTGMVGPLSTAF